MFEIIFKKIIIELSSHIKYIFESFYKTPSNTKLLSEVRKRSTGLIDNTKIGSKYIYYTFMLEMYLSHYSIIPSEFIKNKLLDFKVDLYKHLYYILKNQKYVVGLKYKLEIFFTLSGNEIEFESQLNELVGIYFLENQLNLKVLRVEYKYERILSPYRSNDESCDILASDGNENIYFESKKSLSQDLRPKSKLGEFESFTPISHIEIKKWIRNKLFEANQKGAHYLLVRIPFWSPLEVESDEAKIEIWISRTFPKNQKISFNHFNVELDRLRLNATKGLYIIFPNNYIKIDVNIKHGITSKST